MDIQQEPKKKKYLFMAVTNDKYELPVFFADSGKELAAVTGVSQSTVITYICRENHPDRYREKEKYERMTRTKLRYIKVELPDDEEADLMADVKTPPHAILAV